MVDELASSAFSTRLLRRSVSLMAPWMNAASRSASSHDVGASVSRV